MEQGIGCNVLNPLEDRLSKPRKEAEIVRNFQTFPANFPATGNSRSAHSTAEVGGGRRGFSPPVLRRHVVEQSVCHAAEETPALPEVGEV